MKTRMTALELILHLAEGSTTPNTLQHITKIAREALEAAAQQESVATLYGSLPVYDKPAQQDLPDVIAGALGVSRGTAYDMMREALVEQAAQQQEPVADSVVAGALFDFMGWLTSRKERIVLSSADNASPAVEAITKFAKMRNLSLDDAKVQDWNTAPPQRKPLTEKRIEELYSFWVVDCQDIVGFARAVERTVKGEV